MLIKKDKLSIILNYGCHCNCNYCIWQDHKLSDIKSNCNSFDFANLSNIMIGDSFADLVSISGGGDPFYFADESGNNTVSIMNHHI
ncbi:MAG: hypothetical protein K9M99_07885 [Candidatus Cloacimonetes bacterium]|nr:hypothetical protein [Candidatus Cloacimonadota bacterium]